MTGSKNIRCLIVLQVRMDAKAIAAAKRAAHKETQARLLTATHCRDVGSSGGGSSSSPAVQLEAQQAQR